MAQFIVTPGTEALGTVYLGKAIPATNSDNVEAKVGGTAVSAHEVSDTESESHDHEAIKALPAKYPGLSADDVESIYICTPMQEAILVSQAQGTNDYIIRASMKAHPLNSRPIDLQRLEIAWKSIVQQAAVLRTVFVPSTSGKCLFWQVVLKTVTTEIRQIENDSLDSFFAQAPEWESGRIAPHRVTFCKTPNGPGYVKVELHHGIADAVSSLKIFQELMRLYDNPQAELRGPSFQQFVQHVDRTSTDDKLQYWQNFLAEAQLSIFPRLRIGKLPQRPDARQQLEVKLDRKGILALVSSSRVSFSMFFHAAWSVLLRTYLGRSDVMFGYISSGRHNVPLRNISEGIGPYISMMINRAQVEDSSSLMELASRLRKNVATSLAHEHCSLASIQQKMRSNGRLFNTLVDVQRRPKLAQTSSEIYLDLVHVHTVSEYDIVLNIEDTGSELLAKLHYTSGLLSKPDVENLASSFLTIVNQFLKGPERKIHELELVSPLHQTQIMEWNGSPLTVASACAHDLIEAEAACHPDAEALCSLNVSLTYQELSQLSSRLARYLISAGAGSGTLIPFCMEKSLWAIVSMLAIMKSGAAFVPVDPAAPPSRMSGIIEDANATLIIASQSALPPLADVTAEQRIVVVDEALLNTLQSASEGSSHLPTVGCQEPAYVLFTSGSTGKPKGVVVPHQSLCCSMYGHGPAMGVDQTTRSLQFSAYSFDAIIAEAFTVLLHGGVVCVPSEADRMNNIAHAINEMRVNWAVLMPTLVRLLDPASIPTLRTLVLAGEAADRDCLDAWIGKVKLFNAYGPTETCVVCVATCFSEDLTRSHDTIGKPAGCRAWIVSPADCNILCPVGAVGELLIEGPNVTQGYLGDPEKTAQSFIDAPSWASEFFPSPSQRPFQFYRTGDLVRQLSDGSLKFSGRADSQVKVNGQRLEPGEIEHHALLSDFVVQILVDVPKSGKLRGRLIAVLVLKNIDAAGDASPLQLVAEEDWASTAGLLAQLRDKLQSALPAYMVPTTWIPVQNVRLLPSGKMDRRGIKRWLADMDSTTLQQIADLQSFPTDTVRALEEELFPGDTAKQLRAIWSEVLNIPEHTIGARRPFLALGGDSISAMRVVSKARVHGLRVTVRDILGYGTIADLAPHIQRADVSMQAFRWQQQVEGTRFPLTPIQLLHLDAVPSGTNHFNQSFLLELKRLTEPGMIHRAVGSLIRRHSMLRARYSRDSDGTWWQTITDSKNWRFNVAQGETSLESSIPLFAASQKSLNIEHGPVLSVDLITLQDGRQYLYMVAHHLVIDLVSWRAIFDDLDDELRSHKCLLPEPLSFQHLALAQHKKAANIHAPRALPYRPQAPDHEYWRMSERTNLYGKAISTTFTLDAETTSILMGTANDALRTEPVELIMGIILHAFHTRFSNRPIPTLYTETHGRQGWPDDLDISRTVGWFTSMYPIWIDSNGCTDVMQTIRRVKDARRSIPNQGLDYFTSRYLDETGRELFASHKDMEILFNYQGLYQQLERDGSLLRNVSRSAIDFPSDVAADVPRLSLFDIFSGVENGYFTVTFTWSPDMALQEGIRSWVKDCESLMQDVARSTGKTPLASLSDYPLLSFDYQNLDRMLQKLTRQWNLTSLDEIEDIYPCSPSQEGMIVSQVRQPERNLYNFETTWKVTSPSGTPLDVDRLEAACRAVIQRHQILRTVFCETEVKDTPFAQAVFKNAASLSLPLSRSKLTLKDLAISAPTILNSSRFPYHWLIGDTSDGVYCKFVINHCLLDGSSLGLLVQDIYSAYNNIQLSPAPLYSGFIGHLLDNPTDAPYAFWNCRLREVSRCHFPSLAGAGPTEPSFGRVDISFTKDQVDGIRELCREHDVTLATVMSSIWALVLQAYIGNDEQTVCFGYMASGRDVPLSGVHEVMGPLLNMLVQRVDFESSMSTAEVLKQVHNGVVVSLPHQHCSLAKIHSSLGLNGETLFNTLVNVQKRTRLGQTGSKQPIQMEITDYHDPAEFDVIFNVVDTSEKVTANLHFWTSCISELHAQNVKATLLNVVDSFLQGTSRLITEVNLFAEHHRRQLLEWNPTMPYVIDSCLHHLFETQVARRPDAPALCTTGSDGNWTYAALDDLASRLAAHLSSLGVGPEVTVPFCFDKSPWTVVVMLATLKAGGACLALDPAYPVQRLQDMIAMVTATVIVIQEKHADKFRDIPSLTTVSVTPGLWDQLESRQTSRPPVQPSNAAFVNFTSGSTGAPKGSTLEHRSLCSALWHHHELDPVGEGTRALQFSSYTFDASFAEILLTLCYGGCLCVPTDDERMDRLGATIRNLDINWAYLTPTVSGLLEPNDVPSLKTLCLGGEPVLDSLVSKWLNKVRLIATYGPSECSIAISRSEVQRFGNGQLGPASGALLWIVDPTNPDRLVPIGSPGELLIEGPLVGRGYFHKAQNEATFVVDPRWVNSCPVPGTPLTGRRMYKTGDIVRFEDDGSMVMLGRKDAQVKIHGQRVDLDEVEHHLTVDSEIRHAACLLPKKGLLAGRLTVVLSSMELADATLGVVDDAVELLQDKETQGRALSLRARLEDRVPEYMIPRVWVMAKTVPVSFNGKLNRRALLHLLETVDKSTYEAILSIESDVTQPGDMSAMEEQLRDTWAHVLNLPESHIGLDRSFFSLGGDSISAIQVSSRLRGQGIGLSMHDIMHYRTITEIAKHAQRIQVAAATIPDELLNTLFPLSPIQGFHFDNMPAGHDHYNQSFIVRIKRPIETTALLQALKTIVSRHSMLRARFMQDTDGCWAQLVTDDVESSLIFHVTSGINSLDDTEQIFQEAQVGLEISNGPVLSAQLINLNDGSQYLCLIAHHLVVDLVSWRIILQDLEEALESTSINIHTTISFQSWNHLQLSYSETSDGLAALAPQSVIPSDVEVADFDYWGVPDARSYGTAVFSSFELDSHSTSALLGSANQALSTEPVEIFMAAVFDGFQAVFPQRKIPTLFTEGHGREPWDTNIDVSRTVGWFTTMYPISINKNAGDDSLLSTLRQVKDASRSIPAKGWRYFTSRYLTSAGQNAFAEHGAMEILFNHLGQYQQLERDDALFEQASLPYDLRDFGPGTPRAALFEIVTLIERGRLVFKLGYSSELKHHHSIQQWVQACKTRLIDAAKRLPIWAQPVPTFSDFPLLSKRLSYADLDRVLQDVGSNMSSIEDIYPCSPMQEGILISRARQQGLYDTSNTWKIAPRSGFGQVDGTKLEHAIAQVVSRHQALRTWFVECEGVTPYVQVVWKEVTPPIIHIDAPSAKDFLELPCPTDSSDSKLGYRFVICETVAGETCCRMEINHALIDGLSMQVLVGDILRAYDGLLTTTPFAPRYRDFISYLESCSMEAGLAYWTALLEDLEPCKLPSLSDTNNQPAAFNHTHCELGGSLTQRVHQICKDQNITIATVMSAVWSLVLRAYTGRDKVCFGYVSSGRAVPVPQVESILGPLINMMVSRVDINEQMPLSGLLQNINDRFLNSLAHQHCSLSQIQHAADDGRRRGQLFNTIVNVQKRGAAMAPSSASIELEVLDVHDPSEYDVSLNVEHTERNVTVCLHYWTSCLLDEHAQLMHDTVLQTLNSLLDNVSGTVADVTLFSESHQSRLLKWAPEMPGAVVSCVHDLVERRVHAHPDKEAVCTSNLSMTYQELDCLASHVAAHLASLGVGPEVMVPFCFDKSPWAIVAMYAILKAGGACVALSPEYPELRLASILNSTAAKVVLSDIKHAKRLNGLVNHVVLVDGTVSTVSDMLEDVQTLRGATLSSARPDNTAFVAFTSGSTGTPKGIILEHASISTSIHYQGTTELMSSTSRVLQFSSYTFDVSIEEIFTTLAFGGTICVPSEYERMNELQTFMKSQEVNFAHLTPTVASLLNPAEVSLATLAVGGELVPQSLVRKWASRTNLIASYGPAECSIACSATLVQTSKFQDGALGKPDGSLMWIVDPVDPNKLAPIGCAGEILIEGPLLARGYIDSRQTDKVFLLNPSWTQFVRVPGVHTGRRMYRSGDMARYNLDGSLVSLGRKDSQVKIHGQRTDLGEIEHHLLRECMGQAAALVPKEGYWQNKLVVVFALENSPKQQNQSLEIRTTEEAVPRISELRTLLQGHLPGYMMPRAWIPMVALPMTPNGKLNRRAIQTHLESLDVETCERVLLLGRSSVPNRHFSEVEKQLVSVWATVLGIPEAMVDITQHFFRLGGDSISAMHAAAHLRSRGIRIAVHDILRYRTITALAELVAHNTQNGSSSALHNTLSAIETKDTPFSLTPIQAMHFQANPEGENHFNQSCLLKLRQTFGPSEVREALMTLIQHHSMFNARFSVNGTGAWSQTIVADLSRSLQFESSVFDTLEDAKASFSSSQIGLDIQQGPLVAADLIKVNSHVTADRFLYIVIHHLIVDLVSWRIILEDLEKVLLDKDLGPKPLSFQVWAMAQDEYAKQNLSPDQALHFDTSTLHDHHGYWEMTDRPNTYATVVNSEFTVDSNTTALLLDNANDALRIEPMEVILTLLLFSFGQTFNDRDLPAIFCEGHGRESLLGADLSRTVGWFTTMFPIWIPDLDRSGSLESQLIQALRLVKDCRRMLPTKGWQYFASRYLNENGRSEFSGHDNVEILFNYLGSTSLSTLRDGLLEQVPVGDVSHVNLNFKRPTLFDISVSVELGQLHFSFQYSDKMARQSEISSWIHQCQNLVADAAKMLGQTPPTPTLADYPLLALKVYSELDRLVEACESQLQISSCDKIQSIYPCAPMQEGILLSRLRTAGVYNVQAIWKVILPSSGKNVDLDRLKAACASVISRHDILRTHFVEHHHNHSAFLQVVMKSVEPPVEVAEFANVDELKARPHENIYRTSNLPYLFTICQTTNGDVYLRLDINHALIDGTSTYILLRDLLQAYNSQLPSIGPVYSDFISHLYALPRKDALAFWTELLGGSTPCHFPRLAELASNERSIFQVVEVELTGNQRTELHGFCKKHSTTLANVMSGVWALVLSCFVGTDSSTVTFGYLASGRDIPVAGVHDILGPLITMIIRKTEIEPETTVLEMIDIMQQDLTRSWPYQHCPLGDIYHALNLSGTALFNTIVNVQREEAGIETGRASISFEPEMGHDPSEYDISFNIQDTKDIRLYLGYWNRCLCEAQANVVSRTVRAVISSILANPHQPVSNVELVDKYDIQTLEAWNTSIPAPINQCIHHTIEMQARFNPDFPAVHSVDPSVSLTYQELNDMADNMAQRLSELGVGPESLVPFCMDKSPWTPVTMISILKAGGACVALDPSQPLKRLQGIIGDSGANVVLAATQYISLFSDLVPHVVPVEEAFFRQAQSLDHGRKPASAAQHNNPAFVIFTSGSTGTPKGIVVEHGAFCSSARSHAPALRMERGCRVLQFASHNYDLSIAENLTTLMVGGCICVPSEYDRLNRLADAINAMRVDWMFLTPTVAALLHPDEVPTVKTLVLGGEHATQNNFSSWGSRPGVCLINSYGPAECAIWTNASVDVQATADTSNIGPRLGCSLWVVDPRNHHRLLPIGARGELVIGGPTLARGYLHNTAQTDAVFIKSPDWFKKSSSSSERFYKSGDLARYNLDATLSIRGRKDTQIKVHGHRIELGDIERNLVCIPSVKHATVQLPTSGPVQDQLVALVSLKEIPHKNAESATSIKIITYHDFEQFAIPMLDFVRSELEQQLPKHMLPALWIPVERMPLLSSGKLDKRAAKAWLNNLDQETYNQARAFARLEASPSLAMPETATESELQQIWADVLRCPLSTIPMTQSFLRLGGDSISAMQVVSRARAKGIDIFVQDILRLLTIRKLAQQATDAGTITEPVKQAGRFELLESKGKELDKLIADCVSRLHLSDSSAIEDIFPCSPMQEGILISQAKTRSHYRVKALFKVLVQPSQSVDLNRLEQAWALVAQRHQALRSVLIEGAAGQANFLQVVLKEVSVPVRRLECESVETFEGFAEVNEYAEDGPPYRVSICKIRPDKVYCKLAISHALDDGSSMQVLIRDVCLAYDNMLPSGPLPLYSNFISYIRRQPAETGLNFWKGYLDGAVPTHFPVLQTTADEPVQTCVFDRMIEGENVAAVHRLCQEHGITVADIFKIVWALVLGSFLGTESVCFGYLASGRDTPVEDVHNILGPLINVLIFRADMTKSTRLIDLLMEAHESYMKSLSHQYCSLKEISHAIGAGKTTLFNSLVNVQRATSAFFANEDDSLAQQTITLRNVGLHDPTEYDLSLDVMESKTQIHVILNYWTSLISTEQAASIATTVLAVVDQIVANPFRPARELDFSNENDMALVSQWNSVVPADPGRCLHHLIEEQVPMKPIDAVAVVSDNDCLTYRQLDQMANQLAHFLVHKGARPDVIVPCCFEKSIWAIVAMLAVLKAGAACVALDPAYPLERLQMIVRDTEASFVLTSQSHANLMADVGADSVVVSSETLSAFSPTKSFKGPQVAVGPDNAAFVVYTSGSTGTPKGAVLEHRNLHATSRGLATFNMTSESRVAHFASYAYDVSIEESILALTRGACVCIISDDDRLGDLSGAFNRLQVTWTELTPTVLRMLEPQNLPYLKTVVVGGELLTDDVVAKWYQKVDMFNSYGPCECAITCCATDSLKPGDRGAVIGRPWQSKIWIVDAEDHRHVVPVGAIGELCIEGPLVGRGYLKNPEKTKASFIDASFWSKGPENRSPRRAYKTGDLARWNADGTISYMGRKDNQTKIHGQRIELGEIEYQVSASAGPSVKAVVATVPKHGILKDRLIALLELGDRQSFAQSAAGVPFIQDESLRSVALESIAEIKASVKKTLPRHMVPSLWLPVRQIPSLASGKTNRRLINDWFESMDQETYTAAIASIQAPSTVIPPASEMEKILQNIWSQVLSLSKDSISMDQNFFASGGDSVLAMEFITRCRTQGITTNLRDVFQWGTIAALAPYCTRTISLTDVSNEPASSLSDQGPSMTVKEGDLVMDLANVENIYPCSPMQESILTSQMKLKNSWYANWVMEVRPLSADSGPIGMQKVATSWQQVVNRHSILRTFFQSGSQSTKLYQIVLKDFVAPVSYITRTISDSVNPFVLSPEMPEDGTPPHRLVLAKTSSGTLLLQLQVSHALYDAVSLSVLWHDLQVACTRGLQESRAPSYGNFINYLSGLDRWTAIMFWKNHLATTRSCQFPPLHQPSLPASQQPPGSFASAVVPFEMTQQARAFCKWHAITTANLFQAAWALVLRHFTGMDNVCFGFMLSGRDAPIPEVDSVLGPFINLMPCTVKAGQEASISSMLHGLQADLAEVLLNQNCSLADIQASLGMKEPLFNTFLNMQRVAKQAPYLLSSVQFNEISGLMTDEYAISVYVVDAVDEISISFCYWTSVLSSVGAEKVSCALLQALDLLFRSSPDDSPSNVALA